MTTKDPRPIQKRAGMQRTPAALAVTMALSQAAFAAEIDLGNPDVKLSWDTTLKYSAAWRTNAPMDGLSKGMSTANFDDGNNNFGRGLISHRVDLLTEADLVYQGTFGARVSAAGWYDGVYQGATDHPGFTGMSGAFPNHAPASEFPQATRRLHGKKAELLDAFVFAGFDVGDRYGTARLGRHTLQWGESLFFGANAMAGTMSPVDAIKGLSVPGTPFKELLRPVNQVSGQFQLTPATAVAAYYQLRWEATRLPSAGSYFSAVDMLGDGAECQYVGPGCSSIRVADDKARDSGQWGMQLRTNTWETDFGLYLSRFHSKGSQSVSVLGFPAVDCAAPGAVPVGPGVCTSAPPSPVPGAFRHVYHEDITALGVSASRSFGAVNVGAEASVRHNQDLASTLAVDTSGIGGPASDNRDNPAYAVGKTAHVNLNMLWSLPRTAAFNEASVAAEIIWNRVLSVTKNAEALSPGSTRDATSLRVVFEPTYRAVFPGVDLSVPIGVGYTPKGSRSQALGPTTVDGGGDFSIGLNGSYEDAWRFSLSYTRYFGTAAPGGALDALGRPYYTYGQAMKDRHFVAASLRRTF